MAVTDRGGGAPKESFWSDPRKRGVVVQIVVLAAVGYLVYALVTTTAYNMEQRGIASGFDFLGTTAGFSVSESFISYSEENTYGRAFVVGLLNTLIVSAIGILFATILGFIVGIARLSRNWLIAKLALVYIEVFRNIPLLLWLFFAYFGVLRTLPPPRDAIPFLDTFFLSIRGFYGPKPIYEDGFGLVVIAFVVGVIGAIVFARWAKARQMKTGEQAPVLAVVPGLIFGLPLLAAVVTGFPLSWDYPELAGFNFRGGTKLSPEFIALLFALALYTAAFIAEIVRSGILSVSKGQTEAAFALGIRPSFTMRLIIVPQALRVIIPPLTSQYLNLTKNSSLAAAIAYPDLVLVFAGTTLMQTGQAVEIIAITMAVYLTISLVISFLMNLYNRSMALKER